MKAYSDFIQVRSGKGTEKNTVYVKGYASMKDKPDIYNYMKLPDGKFRSFKSIFTESCIKDMKTQLENKAVFIDGMHETATNQGIMNLAKKYNFDSDDLNDVEAALKMKRLPLAKLVDFDIDDNGLIIGTETNPNFAKADDEHKQYYEAVTGSLMDGYLKGYSINFDIPPDGVVSEQDVEGNQLDFINKVDLYGVSYTDAPALADNSFVDVCMRSMGNFMKVRTMEDKPEQKDKVGDDKTPQTEPVKPEPAQVNIQAEIAKGIQAELDKRNAETEQETIKRERDDYKKQMEDLQKKRSDDSEGDDKPPEQPREKSVVQQQDKYGQPINADNNVSDEEGMKALKEIKEPYEKFMEEVKRPTGEGDIGIRKVYPNAYSNPYNTYGKVLELQREFALHQRPMEGESPQDFQRRLGVLNDGNADMSVKHSVKI